MSPSSSILVGFIGGVVVVGAVRFFDKIKVDDPVGAISVHGVCGAWGTLAIGLFSSSASLHQLGIQAIGVGSAFVWAFGISFPMFMLIKHTIGMRVSEKEEFEGLDIAEHGISGYEGVPSIFNNVG